MNAWLFHPVLAVDAQTIIFFFFVVISFFSWIGKQIKAANEKAGQQRARREQRIGGGGQAREKPLQNEIDAFLEDVLGHDPREEAEQRRRKQEQERRRRQEAAAQRERERSQRKPPQKQRRKPAEKSKKKSLAPSLAEPLAKGVGAHVESYMSPHLEHIETHVDQHVQSHLGLADQEVVSGNESSTAARELFSMLQTPRGMQQVILLSEIFSKPKSQR